MALIRSLNTAVSGLKAQQFRIETIGDNIANVDTTGFKGTRVDFSTILNQSLSYGMAPQGFLGGIDPVQIGLGTQVASTSTDFSQGPTEATGVNTDIAIQGNGFFVLQDAIGSPTYTRDGSFSINPANLLHDTATGYTVQGYMADDNFQVTPGGELSSLEIPVGSMTIARATQVATFSGNLNSDGAIAGEGTQLLSDQMFDSRFTNTDLISSINPLGMARADANTPLQNLVRSLGDYTPSSATAVGTAGTSTLVFPELANQLTGVEIDVAVHKGERQLPNANFTVGDPPPTGGTTLGDFMSFLERTVGINDGIVDGVEQTEHTYSHSRMDPITGEQINGTISLGQLGGADDNATLGSLTDHQSDFRGVMLGDYVRFTSGKAAGQVAEITGISASTPGGPLDTLSFRSDGFNSLEALPAFGDTYVVQAPAGVGLAEDVNLLTLDSANATVSVSAATTNANVRSFTVSDTAFANLPLTEGIATNQLVEYTSGGNTVTGLVTAVVGDTVTISFNAANAQDPDANSTFSFIDLANGSIEVAGNVGTSNNLSDFELTSAGNRIAMFDNPPVVEATGESVSITHTVFDSLGTPRQVNLTFVYESSSPNGPNTWRYFAESVDDADMDRMVGSGTALFSSTGQFLTTGVATESISINLEPTAINSGGVTSPFTFELDLSRLTQFATTTSELQMRDQDGFESGTLEDFAISDDGMITGVFTNGLTRTLGQVALANFANPNGLDFEGGNFYKASVNSGTPQIGQPGTFGRGTVRSGFLEESNVDLAEQFTDLIIGQRAFQANARTITVSDEMLQELVNLV